MKSLTKEKLRIFILFSILFLTLNSAAQQTYKVVCDKTDHTVKVIEAENHAANYVTIKSGFPFRQVAQKWIDDNYSTTKCNPDDFINQTQQQSSQPGSTQNNVGNNSLTTSYETPKRTFLQPRKNLGTQHFRNTYLILGGRFSNLGEAFSLDKNLMFGATAGIEQLFGSNVYFGTGVQMNMYFSDMDGHYDEDTEMLYHFRIPAFAGYRKSSKKMVVMYETGVGFNTRLTGTPLTIETFGPSANKNSFNFLARVKVGSEKVTLSIETDMWLSDVLDYDYKMTSINVGLCFFL